MKLERSVQGYIAVILSAVLYGCMPLIAKHAYADGVTPFTLVFLRNFLALPVLACLALIQNKTLKLEKGLLVRVGATGLFGACFTPLLMYSAYNFMAGGTVMIFHFIYPAIVVLVGVLLREEQLKWGNVIAVGFCFVGICLFYSPNSTLDWRGALLALGSGLTYAGYIVLLSHSKAKRVPAFLFAFYAAAFSCVVTLIVSLASGQFSLPATGTGWLWCFALALGAACGGVVLFQIGTLLIGGQQASILSSVEPLTSVIIGVVFLGDPFNTHTALGSAFVILATVLIGVYNFKKKQLRIPRGALKK